MSRSPGGLPPDVMAIEAIGNVTHDDYRITLIQKAEAMMAQGPIRTLYVIGEEFTGFERPWSVESPARIVAMRERQGHDGYRCQPV